MRRYLLNGAIISSIFGGIGAVNHTRKGPRDWRLVLTWIAWALTLAIAIGTVKKEHDEQELEH